MLLCGVLLPLTGSGRRDRDPGPAHVLASGGVGVVRITTRRVQGAGQQDSGSAVSEPPGEGRDKGAVLQDPRKCERGRLLWNVASNFPRQRVALD